MDRVQCLQSAHNSDNENRQCVDDQCVRKVGLTTYERLSLGTQKSVRCQC